MIDRVGNVSMQGRLDRVERGSGRPDATKDFENLLRGLQQSSQTATRSTRSGQNGLRSRDAGLLNSATIAAAAPAVSTSIRPAEPDAEGVKNVAPAPSLQNPGAARSAADVPGTGFVRTTDTRAPHLPRFKSVPQTARHPIGPYRQAPQNFGGDWWLVSPFTGPEPWRALEVSTNPKMAAVESDPLPDGFEKVFGPRPDGGTAATQWDIDLSYFKGTGIPDDFNEAQLEAARADFEAWGLGEPVFYEGRYGWRVRFPDSQLPRFETTASTALLAPHLVIAEHQVRSIQEGVEPGRYHPWLPERLRT